MEQSFPFELKDLTEKGFFEGIASVYANLDAGGDVVVAGAFTRTLQERGDSRPILWSHDVTCPIGLGKLTDSPEGLLIRGDLDLDTSSGRDAYSRLRKRIVTGLSIGFRIAKNGGVKLVDNVRHLVDLDLFEVSLCCFPMNDLARIGGVKASVKTVRDYERFLREAGWSKSESVALASHGWKGLERAEEGETDLAAWLAEQIQ